jgi:uncharacterized cupin superfamily protein
VTISNDILLGMNLFEPTWDAEVHANGAVLRAVRLARHAGAAWLAANLYELEPGALVSPLHFHHRNEELLFVLAGTPASSATRTSCF